MKITLLVIQVLLLGLQFYCYKTQDGTGTDFKSAYAILGMIPVIVLMLVIVNI